MKAFVVEPENEAPADPYTWPLLSLSPDRGSTGVAAINWLQNRVNVNVDTTYDLNHGSWDDEKQTLADMKETAWMLMMMVDFNVMQGPWDSQERYTETVVAMQKLFRDRRPEQVPLFMDLAHNIIDEQGLDPTTPEALDRAWQLCGDAGPLRTRKYTVNRNRFHGFTERGIEEQTCWWIRLFQFLFVSIEMDYLKGKGFQKLRVPFARSSLHAAGLEGGEAESSTSSARVAPEERAIRAACANAYGIATVMHSDITNLWKLKQFVACAHENKKWQGEANKLLRSVGETGCWLAAQIDGGFMRSLAGVFMQITHEAEVAKIGYFIPGSDHPREEQVAFEDDMASAWAKYCMNLVGNRLKRELGLWSWPSRAVQLTCGDVAASVLHDLKQDFDHHLVVHAAHVTKEVAHLDSIVERSIFQQLLVKQLIAIARKEDWVVTPKMVAWANARFRKILQSQLAEDSFNRMKLSSRQHMNRTARECLHYKSLAESLVMGTVHKFNPVPWGGGEFAHDSTLCSAETFKPPLSALSIHPAGLVSTDQKPSWYSPGAPRLMVGHADLWLRRQAVAELDGLTRIHQAWMGVFMQISHNLIVRTKANSTASKEAGPWLLPLKHVPESCCIFWDCEEAQTCRTSCRRSTQRPSRH